MNLPIEAYKLIPHRGQMCLIDELTAYSSEEGVAQASIGAQHLFLLSNKKLDSVVLTELIAQTAAAHSGFKALSAEGTPMFGFLVGLKDLQVYGSARQGERLTIRIHRDFQMEQVTFLNGKVFCGEKLLAEGVLKLYELPANQIQTQKAPSTQNEMQPFSGWSTKQQTIIAASALNREILRYCSTFQTAENETTASFTFGESFTGFNGHFPDNPIVPGVLLLKTAKLIAELTGEQEQCLRAIHTAKFAKTVSPGEAVRFLVQPKENNIKVQVKAPDALCAKFSFTLE